MPVVTTLEDLQTWKKWRPFVFLPPPQPPSPLGAVIHSEPDDRRREAAAAVSGNDPKDKYEGVSMHTDVVKTGRANMSDLFGGSGDNALSPAFDLQSLIVVRLVFCGDFCDNSTKAGGDVHR
jgi:hypothetical protein